MLQFTQKLWRLETMKISKFLWSVLVVFAAVALIAPQQVEAIVVDGRINGQIAFTGSGTITGTITESNGINSNGIHELEFNGQNFPHGPLSVTSATGDFIPIVGLQANFDLPIRWTGSGSSVTLLDVVPGVVAPVWRILTADGNATGTLFSLKSVTFDEDSLTLIGRGTTQIISSDPLVGDPLVLKHSDARIVIEGTGQDFTYNLTVVTTAVTPEGGSGLGLLAMGLVGLGAVEGLRRKIATRQNRCA
jgi:MYXO-CTERM domain-containing protein